MFCQRSRCGAITNKILAAAKATFCIGNSSSSLEQFGSRGATERCLITGLRHLARLPFTESAAKPCTRLQTTQTLLKTDRNVVGRAIALREQHTATTTLASAIALDVAPKDSLQNNLQRDEPVAASAAALNAVASLQTEPPSSELKQEPTPNQVPETQPAASETPVGAKGSKRCTKCLTVKQRSLYSRDRTRRDGLHSWCKACKTENNRTRYRARAAAMAADAASQDPGQPKVYGAYFLGRGATKKCTKCREVKQVEEFHTNANLVDGLNSWCKACRILGLEERYKERKAAILGTSAQGNGSGAGENAPGGRIIKPGIPAGVRQGGSREESSPSYPTAEGATAEELRQCTTCKQQLPLESFSRNFANASRLNYVCNACSWATAASSLARLSPEEVAARVAALRARSRVCSMCGRELPGRDFRISGGAFVGQSRKCRACEKTLRQAKARGSSG